MSYQEKKERIHEIARNHGFGDVFLREVVLPRVIETLAVKLFIDNVQGDDAQFVRDCLRELSTKGWLE